MRRIVARRLMAATAGLLVVGLVGRAWAAPSGDAPNPGDVTTVLNNLRLWVMSILAALATLYLTIAGVRFMVAGGDPVQVEKAKSALRSAALGYALAALSPVLFAILDQAVTR